MNSSQQPIFLVEDNPMDVDLTRRAFARRKIANPIQVARDGEEALAWISRWEAGEPRPAVILLDLKLPRVNGLEGRCCMNPVRFGPLVAHWGHATT